ncbi:dipeptide/oligopeptide/nickel ABC transporter permease/ATP-binding protein [Schumannella soli]|uniref:Dipeptide/oligopeptide/nickel ABC transporter permease/ATP-binding protein n=1 Tax=Schumannella soli TaxID=2590779 RepID=A0A506XZ91_9MICO|nr:dipeptide/oligopeptide/nickel ABC transporter permease/ATP-binding protein [Schumannella soli]TPW74038.1 dipeptide/oligopeptide/nickel ABC transporter permease/ATP-binding protein [Schumannella soli]
MTSATRSAGQTGEVVRPNTLRRLLRNPLGLISIIVLGVLLILAIIGPWIAPYSQTHADIAASLAGPSADHLLGTDSPGRDVLSRLLFGTQLTIFSGLLCAAVAIAIGLPSGLLAGYYGGWFDSVAGWAGNMLMSLPGIVVLLAVRAALGPSVWISMIIFGVLLSPGYFRLTRTAVQSVRNELYVDAARVAGLSDGRIIARHIFSVVRAPIIIQTAIVTGVAISIQAGLQFLGLGDPGEASWGAMVNEGFKNIYVAPGLIVPPIVMIGLTIGALVLLANALRDALEDGQKVSRKRRLTDIATGAVTMAMPVVKTGGSAERTAAPARGKRAAATVEAGTEHHLVKVTGLGVGYPQADGSTKHVVDDVSFHVDRGEVLGIVGESGSGKSQTAFSILGLLPDNAEIIAGSIQFDGKYTVEPGDTKVDQARVRPLRGKRIAYIPQEPMSNLDPNFTIGHQLARPLRVVMGMSKAAAKARAIELLGLVGIVDPARTYDLHPHEISGGMAQRVLIAGAISCEPDLIIADEPTTALDVTVQAEVLDLLRGLQKRIGMGIVLVTHNFGVVADLADRVLVMQAGHVVESGDVRQILRDPQNPYTRILLSAMLEGKEPMTMLTEVGRERAGARA